MAKGTKYGIPFAATLLCSDLGASEDPGDRERDLSVAAEHSWSLPA